MTSSPADTEENAQRAFKYFCRSYRDKYEKAVQTREKNRDELTAFSRFPTAYWKHIRSTNVIESVFATVRLRTYKTKGLGTHTATPAITLKLLAGGEKDPATA